MIVHGVIDEIQGQISRRAEPRFVQVPERADGFFKHPVSALGVYVFLEIARQRADEFDPVLPVEID